MTQGPGRPADVISEEMINHVERLVLNNRQIKVAELASECGISNGSVYTIIHEHLGMSKVSARWVPRNLNSKGWSQVKNFWKCTMPIQKTFTLALQQEMKLRSTTGTQILRVHAMEAPWLTPT